VSTVTVQDQQGHTYTQDLPGDSVRPIRPTAHPFLNPIAAGDRHGGATNYGSAFGDRRREPIRTSSTPASPAAKRPTSYSNETQQITRNANGSVTFSFNGANATPITLSATTAAADLQNETCQRSPHSAARLRSPVRQGGPFTVTFDNSLGDVPQITAK